MDDWMHTGGLVYLVRIKDTNRYKIGLSTPWSIEGRVKALQIGCPDELELVDWVHDKRIADEKRLHEIYKEYKIRGEWFEIPNIPWWQILRPINPISAKAAKNLRTRGTWYLPS